jgi:hypothetical protein
MSSLARRAAIALKALRQLGPRQAGLYAGYQLLLRTGVLRRLTPEAAQRNTQLALRPLFNLPPSSDLLPLLGPNGLAHLRAEADEIAAGQVRLFGGEPVPLVLTSSTPRYHWTEYETRRAPRADIKLVWEPARFGWAFTLGRAYHLTGDERYPEAFWRHAETFWQANPPNRGPNWASAQEVALRLMAFVFAAQVFASSLHTTPTRLARLAQSVAGHAVRIPPTLAYARAQNNNHLLSEAAGLITAGLALPDHPQAARWLKLGRRWFEHGLCTQIAPAGAYCQHSANYHRLMLQLALWVAGVQVEGGRLKGEGMTFDFRTFGKLRASPSTFDRLSAATRWLMALCDPETGRLPNLGPNDGAYVFPLTVGPFSDYRPVLQAAARAFLREDAFEPGPWDEMSLWLQVEGSGLKGGLRTSGRLGFGPSTFNVQQPAILRNTQHGSWAYLRAARFTSRPGHADQLHLDLWWRGLNIAQDAGTYLYNALPPWDNALSNAFVHNTITVNGQDQMTRAGRFLYLDWAQAEIIVHERAEDGAWERITAQHDGYRRLGVIHRRQVTAHRDGRWVVEDSLSEVVRPALSVRRSETDLGAHAEGLTKGYRSKVKPSTSTTFDLHWLLPDWPYELQIADGRLRICSPYGWIVLQVKVVTNLSPATCNLQPPCTLHPAPCNLRLIRAGELLHGPGPASPIQGWTSPTYGTKIPALSLSVEVAAPLPITLMSEFIFPQEVAG